MNAFENVKIPKKAIIIDIKFTSEIDIYDVLECYCHLKVNNLYLNYEEWVKSKEFKDGRYTNKTITVHSKKRGAETDANMKLLLDVERADNPVEIVIHVNILKEG